jgi:parafibromin
MRGSLASTPLSATKRAYATPIIILPSAVTSLLTMANAARFLDHGVYVPIDAKAAAASTLKDVMIQHKHNNVMCEFRLVDSAARLNERPEYWERVVAVFATGQPWQFSGFKWSEPVDLFQHVLGVHVMFADSEVNANIQSWNCRVLKVRWI